MCELGAGNGAATDAFERDYAAGILAEEPEPTAPPPAAGPPRAAFTPAEPFALRGCVLGPTRRIDDGYVVVDGDAITAVGSTKPDPGLRVIDTDGVILPGLIDLHGHPEYNVFAAWEPPVRYTNRYRWRDSREYEQVVKLPWGRLAADAGAKERLTRYAEIRALVGGVTAIQGATPRYPTEEALVRNVDRRIFGRHRARSLVDIGRLTEEARTRLRDQIAAGEVTAFYVHLAEGTDDASRAEFEDLVALDLLTAATVIIHGTALSREQLGRVKEAGAKLVWSPQSNLRLYGQTTLAAEAMALGIPIGLGADWLPSGSPSLLAELKVARRLLRQQGARPTPKRLVDMVTADAARIAGLDDHLGTLAPGCPADLLVLERRHADPWENVVEADPSWVELVAIGGDLAYGRRDWLATLGRPPDVEDVIAWGKPMALDTSYAARARTGAQTRLADLRAILVALYPQVGPIFA